MPESQGCVFCNIVGGRLPAYKVYEDDEYLAFLDIRPLNPGHTLVIPKLHYKWTYDVPRYGEYLEVVKKVGLAILSALGAESFSVVTLGHEVPHAHVWIVPRFQNDGHGVVIDWTSVKSISKEDMQRIADEITNSAGSGQKHL